MPAEPGSGSTLLLDEYFESGDERFLPELLDCRASRKLKSLADRWFDDPRPFARQALLAYLDDGCDRPFHRPLVKGLFRRAEAKSDHELLAHFLVAFDRFGIRRIVQRPGWDWQARQAIVHHVLLRDRQIPGRASKDPKGFPRFSRRTRLYLCRRVFRHFRVLGRRDPAGYRRWLGHAVALFEDAHLQRPEQLLDAWSLVNALYHDSPLLQRNPRGVRVAPGKSLADLKPAPLFLSAWSAAPAELLDLAQAARSRTVRLWAIGVLEQHCALHLQGLPIARVRLLLDSPHEELQSFGARLLEHAEGLPILPVRDWLALLRSRNLDVLPRLCQAFERHVHPDRLALAQCCALAGAQAAPVAELGLRWARQKPVRDVLDLEAVLLLKDAPAPGVRRQAVEWIAELLDSSPLAGPIHVRDLVDARFPEARQAGLALLAAKYPDEPSLWLALSESPHDDVRVRLVAHLARREEGLPPDAARRVWASALLAIHRGSRAKRAVLRQVAARVAEHPEQADELLPLLGFALRSVRDRERREGLAAVARAAFANPGLRAAIAARLPELRLFPEAVA
jgi:hypothetical protein